MTKPGGQNKVDNSVSIFKAEKKIVWPLFSNIWNRFVEEKEDD